MLLFRDQSKLAVYKGNVVLTSWQDKRKLGRRGFRIFFALIWGAEVTIPLAEIFSNVCVFQLLSKKETYQLCTWILYKEAHLMIKVHRYDVREIISPKMRRSRREILLTHRGGGCCKSDCCKKGFVPPFCCKNQGKSREQQASGPYRVLIVWRNTQTFLLSDERRHQWESGDVLSQPVSNGNQKFRAFQGRNDFLLSALSRFFSLSSSVAKAWKKGFHQRYETQSVLRKVWKILSPRFTRRSIARNSSKSEVYT